MLAVTAAQLWANLMQGFQGTHTISGYHGWRTLRPSYELISRRAFRAPVTVLCSNNLGKRLVWEGGEILNHWMFQTLCRKSVLLEYPKICFILLLYGVVSVCTTILLLLTTLTTCKLLFAVNLVHSVSYVTLKKEYFPSVISRCPSRCL